MTDTESPPKWHALTTQNSDAISRTRTAMTYNCAHCGFEIPVDSTRCSHCARPGLFPNVARAELDAEKDALASRFDLAVQAAIAQGVDDELKRFHEAANKSNAVISRPFSEVFRLATNDRELYATYYQLRNLRLASSPVLPADPNWDVLRTVADAALFGDTNKHEIRFAALALGNRGLVNYGECWLVLRIPMMAHRSSVFEENSVTFMKHHDIRVWEVDRLPKGYRASWSDRARLCVAKLAAQLAPGMQQRDFESLLITDGRSSADDNFVEVHILGPMTIRTVQTVSVDLRSRHPGKARMNALEHSLSQLGVFVEVRT